MAAATVNITGILSGEPAGNLTIGPITTTSATANGSITQVVLQAGANTITVPSTPAPTGCIIQLPSTNTSVTTLKGVAGDTGIAIGKTTSHLLTWDPAAVPASFVLSSVSTQTGLVTTVTFF